MIDTKRIVELNKLPINRWAEQRMMAEGHPSEGVAPNLVEYLRDYLDQLPASSEREALLTLTARLSPDQAMALMVEDLDSLRMEWRESPEARQSILEEHLEILLNSLESSDDPAAMLANNCLFNMSVV